MPVSTLTSKGQVTVPKEIRDLLKLTQGQQLDFQVRAGGQVVLRPKNRDVRRLKGIVGVKRAKPVTIRQLNESIADGYADV
jgi:AbrB family looped-hinge helix DNA binding protein